MHQTFIGQRDKHNVMRPTLRSCVGLRADRLAESWKINFLVTWILETKRSHRGGCQLFRDTSLTECLWASCHITTELIASCLSRDLLPGVASTKSLRVWLVVRGDHFEKNFCGGGTAACGVRQAKANGSGDAVWYEPTPTVRHPSPQLCGMELIWASQTEQTFFTKSLHIKDPRPTGEDPHRLITMFIMHIWTLFNDGSSNLWNDHPCWWQVAETGYTRGTRTWVSGPHCRLL
jgi:hypothetical protein